MKATILVLTKRGLTVLVMLLFFSTIFTAQVKIKERVEIVPKASTSYAIENFDEIKRSFTLRFPAEVTITCPYSPHPSRELSGYCITCNGQIAEVDSSDPEGSSTGVWPGGNFGIFPENTEITFTNDLTPSDNYTQDQPLYVSEETLPLDYGGSDFLWFNIYWLEPETPPFYMQSSIMITINPIDSCMIMSVTKSHIHPGEKDSISMMKYEYGGSMTPYPVDQIFSIRLKTNDQYGKLRCPATGAEGTWISGTQPFEFIANDNIDVDSAVVGIEATVIQGETECKGIVTVTIKRELERFLVTLDHDMLKNRDVSVLTVIAVDKDNNELHIDTMSAINLMFSDLHQYVDFISAANDTLDELKNVPYGVLRSGQVKIIARGTESEGPVTAPPFKIGQQRKLSKTSDGYRTDYPSASLFVSMANDVTKMGYCDYFIMPEIKVIAVADSIKPNYPTRRDIIPIAQSRTDVKVAVTISGILYGGPPYQVQISSYAVEGSGGHSHTGNRPTGRLIDNGDTLTTFYKPTTGDTIRLVYQASLFGGIERIKAKLTELTPAITDSDFIVVRVPGLVPLPSGVNNLITYTSPPAEPLHHLVNSNYGIGTVCTAISLAVTDYANEYGLENDIFLVAIDMSLPFGGKFEIHGNWESGRGPHEFHRIGKSVDFTKFYRDAGGNTISVNFFNEDNELIKTTNQINLETLDDKFDRRGFDRWERPEKIHYELRN